MRDRCEADSPSCDERSTQEAQPAEVFAQVLLSLDGSEPDRRRFADERRIRLLDQDMRDAGAREPRGPLSQRRLVGDAEDVGVGALLEIAWRALARCVDHLGGEDAAGQVGADDDVVVSCRA